MLAGNPARSENPTAAAAATAAVRGHGQDANDAGQLHVRVSAEREGNGHVGRRQNDAAAQARDDLGGGQPQRAVEDVQHVGLPGKL